LDDWQSRLSEDGIVSISGAIPPAEVARLLSHLSPVTGAGDRRLNDDPVIRDFATNGGPARLAREVLGQARVVRILFFDKHPDANWKVPYHQDLTITVAERVEADGFEGWSVKAGRPHVRATRAILEQMVAVRIHLDDCGEDNGPLRAIPGSHRESVLPEMELDPRVAAADEQTYISPEGGAILMRPLTLHASSPSQNPRHRRVIHIEYAGCELPPPLKWNLDLPCVESA